MEITKEGIILARLTKQNSCWEWAGVINMKGGEWRVWLDMESNHTSRIRGLLLKLGSSKTDIKAQKWGQVEKSAEKYG